MARQSIILLNSTQKQVNVVGLPVKAPGYYGSGNNLCTVAVYLNNFSGNLYIDATLASNPCEEDWFPINLNGYIPYLQYPYTVPSLPDTNSGITGIDNFSFDGNFVYLRARVDRLALVQQYTEHTDFGEIAKILINY